MRIRIPALVRWTALTALVVGAVVIYALHSGPPERGRYGTFIEKVVPPGGTSRELDAAARTFAVRAVQLGVDPAQALESVGRAFEQPLPEAGPEAV